MDSKDLREAIGKPLIARLKALGGGIKVGKVLGKRVLVKTIIPFTDMDRVEKEGTLVVPKHVKKDNTPPPSTGIIIQIGDELIRQFHSVYVDQEAWPYKEGTIIMFSRFAGTDFLIDEEGFRILDWQEILCTLEDTQRVVEPVEEDKLREDTILS